MGAPEDPRDPREDAPAPGERAESEGSAVPPGSGAQAAPGPAPEAGAGAAPGRPAASEPPAEEPPGDKPAPPGPEGGTHGPPAAAESEPPAKRASRIAEPPESLETFPRRALAARTRRDFLLFAAGTVLTALGAWWLLPDRTRSRLLPQAGHDALDTLAARVGLTRDRREAVLDHALTFDDDVAEALYSRDRRVRTYRRSDVTPLRNNYNGRTPGPGYLPGWRLRVSGLASGAVESLSVDDLLVKCPFHEQVTRLVCVEGWSAIAWWGGIRFADFLDAFPPAPGTRWAALRSSVNLDPRGRPDPYDVSLDLGTAHHPQVLLATHLGGRPLTVQHGAPLRLLAPMKLGLKNIKALTDLEYTATEPRDYWAERGYSKYDGL